MKSIVILIIVPYGAGLLNRLSLVWANYLALVKKNPHFFNFIVSVRGGTGKSVTRGFAGQFEQ